MSDRDWDDDLDPEERSAQMDVVRTRLGLAPRHENFRDAAEKARG